MTSKHFTSLSLNKQKNQPSKEIQNVFGDEESDEDAKPQTSAEKFQSKFGNLKARDDRAVQKVLAENPDIYDYDAAYDDIQDRRNRMEEEKEASRKVDKKARYTDRLLEAKKKRDLEKLLRDERKQEKERVAEGDEFKDKEVFVTGAYRKQLEETVKFRKELEESDRIDDMTSVSGQKMWRENFGKKMLEDKLRGRFLDTDEEPKKEVKKEALDSADEDKSRIREHKIKKEHHSHDEDEPKRQSRRHSSASSDEKPRRREHKIKKEHRSRDEEEFRSRRRRHSSASSDDRPKRREHEIKKEHRSRDEEETRSRRRRRHSSSSEEERRKRRKNESRRRRYSSSPEERSRKKRDRHESRRRRHSRSPDERKRRDSHDEKSSSKRDKKETGKVGYRKADKQDRVHRMDKIREILKRRNNSKQIEDARQRYLERREKGLIIPPC